MALAGVLSMVTGFGEEQSAGSLMLKGTGICSLWKVTSGVIEGELTIKNNHLNFRNSWTYGYNPDYDLVCARSHHKKKRSAVLNGDSFDTRGTTNTGIENAWRDHA
jgi:hypothetical protein